MRSAIKAALSLSVGSTALILSGVAFGQATGIPGINFGSQANETACTLGVAGSCRILASGTGFVQRQFAGTDGKTYIQTQIDDTKGFKSEDFVRLGSGTTNEPGISSKLDLAPTAAAGDTFATGSLIKSGWSAADPAKTEATINLSVGRSGTTDKADDFKSDFVVSTTYDKVAGTNTISNLRVDQIAYLGSSTQKQVFATQIKAASKDSGPLKFVGDLGPGTSWTANQMVQATYVGQAVNVGTTAAPAMANFSSETAANLAATTATTASNLNLATPTNWSATGPAAMQEFTPLPVFPLP